MARKPKHEEHENHERWLVSSADFITLLFAFFVVMYSISSVNEGKYRVLSNSIVSAFNKDVKSLDPIQHGTPLRAPIIQHRSLQKNRVEDRDRIGVDYQIIPTPEELAQMQKTADEVSANMQDLVDEGLASVNKTNKGVEIEINSEVLFSSGQANLNSRAVSVLRRIANILSTKTSDINIEGFTDNVPIKTRIFPSNWELSAARAASVVRLFSKSGVDADRLVAIGYGEHQPVATNLTAAGRKQNRRIAIMVLNRPRDDKVKIDDRTQEEKEADARRKLMKSFGVKSVKPGSDKEKSKPAPIRLPSKSKPVVLGGSGKSAKDSGGWAGDQGKTSAPTVIGKPVTGIPASGSAAKNSPQNPPVIIQLPKPAVIPGR